jgi:hypothetical protein
MSHHHAPTAKHDACDEFHESVIMLVDENVATVKQLGQSAHELAAPADALTGHVQHVMLPG